MAQDSPSRKLDQYIVRFPQGMRDKLKEEAAKNNRSLNAEIIDRLEETFKYGGGLNQEDKEWLRSCMKEEMEKVAAEVAQEMLARERESD